MSHLEISVVAKNQLDDALSALTRWAVCLTLMHRSPAARHRSIRAYDGDIKGGLGGPSPSV